MILFERPTLEKILREKEGQLFDFKSARLDHREVAAHFVAFANADGGLLAIGIEKDGTITGVNEYEAQVNAFLQAAWNLCVPPVMIAHKFVDCVNHNGKADRIMLIEVAPGRKLHATSKDEVYLRIGDQSRKLTFDERLQLAYDRGDASWESTLIPDFSLDELDKGLLQRYRRMCGTSLSSERLLVARNLAEQKKDEIILNRAGVLLFAKNPYRWFPRADVRFLRYEGTVAETGPRMNLVKDIRLDLPLPKLLDEAFRVVSSQLREFTRLVKGGKFETTLEYPVFAWQEAISNAVIHRAYNITGTDIQVKMFDDRLEVESPGKLPGLVRLHNMHEMHFSRNPLIARIMTEMKYMRDFGEGVDRMIREMKAMGLEPPVFEEYAFMFRVTLRNNLEKRQLRQTAMPIVEDKRLANLNERQKKAVSHLQRTGRITVEEYLKLNPGITDRTARRDLNSLSDLKMVKIVGSTKDRYYIWAGL